MCAYIKDYAAKELRERITKRKNKWIRAYKIIYKDNCAIHGLYTWKKGINVAKDENNHNITSSYIYDSNYPRGIHVYFDKEYAKAQANNNKNAYKLINVDCHINALIGTESVDCTSSQGVFSRVTIPSLRGLKT